MALPHPAPPEEMSARAMVYLTAGVFRHTGVGLFCILAANQFAAAAFIPVINFFGLRTWGFAMLITAATLAAGALFRHRTLARAGLIISAAVTGILATGLWIGASAVWLQGGKATPITAILLTALVWKDLAVCTDPMKTPLEFTGLWRRAARGGVS